MKSRKTVWFHIPLYSLYMQLIIYEVSIVEVGNYCTGLEVVVDAVVVVIGW